MQARKLVAFVALACSGCLLSPDGPCNGGGVRVPPDNLCECPDGSVLVGRQCDEEAAALALDGSMAVHDAAEAEPEPIGYDNAASQPAGDAAELGDDPDAGAAPRDGAGEAPSANPGGGTSGATTDGTAGTSGGMGGNTGETGGMGGTTQGAGGTGGTSACTPAPTKKFLTVWEPGGAGGDYTVVRPTTLSEGGFMHPPVAWGNGVTTGPHYYTELLDELASNGFVVIADPGIAVSVASVREGLEWLIAQGSGSGKFAGKLALDCAGTIGYSMGGGAAVGAGAHPAVKAVVTIHGLADATENAKGPVLITVSEQDSFVTKAGFAVPTYNRSTKQPTMLASHATGDHLEPLGNGGADAEPAIAWLQYWIYGDQSKRDFFFGANCKLCSWPDVRRKNHPEWTGK